MSTIFKQSIALSLTVFIVIIVYYGAFLPLKKSQLYINAMRNMPTIRTLGDLDNNFKKVFNFYSPVGHDEIISSYVGNMLNLVASQRDKATVDALIFQIENNAENVLKTNNRFNYGQTIFSMGLIYQISGKKFSDKNYQEKAIKIFEKGLKYNSKRSTFVYGLFDTYRDMGKNSKAKEIGESILKYWPSDKEVSEFIKNN